MTKFQYRFRKPFFAPSDKGAKPPVYRKQIIDGVIVETDVAVTLRDGVTIYVDVYRPLKGVAAPLIGWGPYGKHGHTQYSVNFPKADVDDSEMSDFTAFEAPDPFYWVPKGYGVIYPDPRGTWHSEGRATYLSRDEALDYADLIEWAGTREWSNGKVGLSGVSYLTSAQWRVAELNPPHLAAINPWEGWSDMYREVVRHGGIPETSFWDYLPGRWGHSVTEIEDLRRETAEREFFDDYWQSKAARLEQIKIPAFVCASWSDQALHTRGTLEGFRRISSTQKWLYVHGRKKWAMYYDKRSVAMQLAFFDHFLLGKEAELENWPPVRFELRDRFGQGSEYAAQDWPIEGTQYEPLYLGDQSLKRTEQAPSKALYDPEQQTSLSFDHIFDEATDVVGHMALKLWVEITQGEDMDIFVAIQKLDRDGNVVPFAFYAQYEDGPVALGWLRLSHRELDDTATTYQPILKHQRALPVPVGEKIEADIEIWPSGTRFEAGEGLRLIIAGQDIYDYPEPSVYARHKDLRNLGSQIVHFGGETPSRLLIPVVPTMPQTRN